MTSATTYRYLFCDLVTNAVLAELPLTGVNFTQQLNSAGTFQGHLQLSGINAKQLNVANATVPARTALYIDRNGKIVWGGIIWWRNYVSETQRLEFTGREFLSYFEHRVIAQTSAFQNIDQMQVALSLIQASQSVPFGNIGLTYGTEGTTISGSLITRIYYSYELKNLFQALQDLSRQNNGFDFAIDPYYDGSGNPLKAFNMYYPRNGIAYSATTPTIPVFQFPAGNIVSYEYPEDGSLVANTIYALGAGSNEGKLVATSADATKLSAGWALLEGQANYSDVTDPVMLGNLASGQLNAVSYPPTTIKVVAPPSQMPVFGTYEVSDDVRVIIKDDRFPDGFDAIYRIVALNMTPGEDGPERVTLTLAQGSI